MRTHILIAAALILSTSVSAHAGASRGLSVPQPSAIAAPTDAVQATQLAVPATSAGQTAPVAQQAIAQQPVLQQPVSQPSTADQQAAAQQQAAQQQALIQQQMQMKKAQMQQARMIQMKKQQMMQQRMANMSLEDAVGYKLHQVKMSLVRALLN